MLIIKAFSSSAVSKFRSSRRRKRKATEQQLAQEQAAEGEEENKGECGTKLDAIGYFVCPLLEKLVEFADGTWGLAANLYRRLGMG